MILNKLLDDFKQYVSKDKPKKDTIVDVDEDLTKLMKKFDDEKQKGAKK